MSLKGLVVFLCVFSAISEISVEDGVWVLTDSNFEEALDLQPDLLVEFYAPWCGHCKSLAPEYSKAAATLSKSDPPIHIAKLDATENSQTASRFGVSGYPTLKYFVAKDPTEYTGGRTEDTIVSWVQKRTQPSLTVVDCACELEEATENNKITAVLFAQKDSAEAQIFENVSKSVDGVRFVLSTSPDGLEKYAVTEASLVLFKQFDDKRVDFSGAFTQAGVVDFINKNRVPWVIQFNEEAIELIFRNSNPVIFLFSATYSDYQEAFQTLSQEFKGALLFCEADLFTTDNGRLSEFLGISGNAQPTALILDVKNSMAKFKLAEALSEDSLRTFIKNWQGNYLHPFVKSQEIPAQSHEGGVRVLVGLNFAEVVYDSTKDVLVEFYAPWCGHCKTLAPEYEKLAQKLANVGSVVIAKIDYTANEVKGEEVKGFPTLKFYPANSKRPIDYDGSRDAEGLESFITEKAYFKFSGAERVEL